MAIFKSLVINAFHGTIGGKKCGYDQFLGFYKRKMKKAGDMDRDMRAAFEAIDKEG